MTKPQIWVASFLILFILLFIIGRVTKEEDTFKPVSTNDFTGQSSTENLTAGELIANFGCTDCHGTNLDGTKKGPVLQNIGEHFSREELIAYLRNPNSFMGSERFKEYRKQFPGVVMPNFGNRNVKDLGKIADYLLRR